MRRRRAVLMMRQAISPRLAIRIFANMPRLVARTEAALGKRPPAVYSSGGGHLLFPAGMGRARHNEATPPDVRLRKAVAGQYLGKAHGRGVGVRRQITLHHPDKPALGGAHSSVAMDAAGKPSPRACVDA